MEDLNTNAEGLNVNAEDTLTESSAFLGNLCVYEPSALRKKPSTSSEETL